MKKAVISVIIIVLCVLIGAHIRSILKTDLPDSPILRKFFLAINNNDITMVKDILAKNPSICKSKGKSGEVSLHYAAFKGNKDMINLLIAKGADVNDKENDLKTPLHLAAFASDPEVAKLLISKGAQINAKDNNGKTALDYAKESNNFAMVKFLVKNGAKY
jgi:ankyrin repeat protein